MAQTGGQHRPEDDDGAEYLELGTVPQAPYPDNAIYFNEPDHPNPPTRPPAMNQEASGSIYDLPGTSNVHRVQGRVVGNQQKRGGKNENNGGGTVATKVQTTIIAMVLIISVSALVLTLVAWLDGKIRFKTPSEQRSILFILI